MLKDNNMPDNNMELSNQRLFSEMIGALHSEDREKRYAAVKFFSNVISEEGFKSKLRIRAIRLLKKVLIREKDIYIREAAAEGLEKQEILKLGHDAREIAAWWEWKKEGVKQKIILISDDELHADESIRIWLKMEGFANIHIETDGLETIRTAERIRPDLIITDLYKPGMFGEDMAAEIKRRPAISEIPIFSWSGPPETANWYELFCAFINKPFNLHDLTRFIYVILTSK